MINPTKKIFTFDDQGYSKDRLQEIISHAYSRSLNVVGVPGIQLCVFSDKHSFLWAGSVGYTKKCDGDKLSPFHPVRIASNTKTYVATAILLLVERGKLKLDAPINLYISSEHSDILTNGGYSIDRITIRQLLNHTSGLFDYADSPEFERLVEINPTHIWTRTEQLIIAIDNGSPYGLPGAIYRYSDTGYILLGEILEKTYQKPLAVCLRELIGFSDLGLSSTWLEGEEDRPGTMLNRVHQYYGETDSYSHHPSMDAYGGGGLVSTVEDLSRFIYALFNARIYSIPNTVKTMLTAPKSVAAGPVAYSEWEQVPGSYGLGLEMDQNRLVFSHSGYWGTHAAYIPSLHLSLAFSINLHHAQQRNQLIEDLYDFFGLVIS